MYYSLIIPVYNRPDEVGELLESLTQQHYNEPFEIIVIEDGSTITSKDIVERFRDRLNIQYHYKPNSGPGDSRNFGMSVATGDYFIIFDSDCIIPPQYLSEVTSELISGYADCFGGPDNATDSFSDIQKAINFAMTSFLTTGGIRGGSENAGKFQPRSFNMGLSPAAFAATGGFGNIHPGEDPDLTMRLWKLGFSTKLFPKAFVYHKRRIDWEKFSIQVSKFGKARPILNMWHPQYTKLTFFFPTIFIAGFYLSLLLLIVGFKSFAGLYVVYFLLVLLMSSLRYKSLKIGILAIVAVWKQMNGYGLGFAESFFKINIKKQNPQEVFPELFFRK
jgi:glycosyltransferase involved in cell wall biosynthesis